MKMELFTYTTFDQRLFAIFDQVGRMGHVVLCLDGQMLLRLDCHGRECERETVDCCRLEQEVKGSAV